MKYLIDADWIIDALKGIEAAHDLLDTLSADGVAVSIVVLGELFEGVVRLPDAAAHLAAIRRFLIGYTRLNLSDPIMEIFAHHRAFLRDQGQSIPDLDLLIAATALAHDLTLVTRNRRHFARVPGLRLHAAS